MLTIIELRTCLRALHSEATQPKQLSWRKLENLRTIKKIRDDVSAMSVSSEFDRKLVAGAIYDATKYIQSLERTITTHAKT